jgi:lysozyme
MDDAHRAKLAAELRRDEGIKEKLYKCTAGKISIGIGRNLEDRGITRDEAEYLLKNDMAETFADLDRACPWWKRLTPPQQRGLANMCFNLGLGRLLGFRQMLAALERGDGRAAADHALASLWARQVGERAQRIARLFRGEAG